MQFQPAQVPDGRDAKRVVAKIRNAIAFESHRAEERMRNDSLARFLVKAKQHLRLRGFARSFFHSQVVG